VRWCGYTSLWGVPEIDIRGGAQIPGPTRTRRPSPISLVEADSLASVGPASRAGFTRNEGVPVQNLASAFQFIRAVPEQKTPGSPGTATVQPSRWDIHLADRGLPRLGRGVLVLDGRQALRQSLAGLRASGKRRTCRRSSQAWRNKLCLLIEVTSDPRDPPGGITALVRSLARPPARAFRDIHCALKKKSLGATTRWTGSFCQPASHAVGRFLPPSAAARRAFIATCLARNRGNLQVAYRQKPLAEPKAERPRLDSNQRPSA
jgi:hypothetical protein